MSDRTKVARIISKSLKDLQSRSEVKQSSPTFGGGTGNAVILALAEKGPLSFNDLLSQVPGDSAMSLAQTIAKLNDSHLITDQEPVDGRFRLTERGRDLSVALLA